MGGLHSINLATKVTHYRYKMTSLCTWVSILQQVFNWLPLSSTQARSLSRRWSIAYRRQCFAPSVNQALPRVKYYKNRSTFVETTVKQEVWPPGSADTVCPRPPLMTQVQHFVSRIKNRQRWDVQTMWAYDLDLWPFDVETGRPMLVASKEVAAAAFISVNSISQR